MNEIQFLELSKVLRSIDRSLGLIARGEKPAPLADLAKFFLMENGQKKRWETMLSVKADAAPQKFRVEFTDKLGNAAPIDGDPKVSLLNEGEGLAEVQELKAVDGQPGVYEGVLAFKGKAGNTKIFMNQDGDMDPAAESRFDVESEDVQILPANASVGRITFLP